MSRKKSEIEQTETEVLVDKARASEGIVRARELEELRHVLVDERLRDFLWRLLERSQMFSEQFNPNFGITGHNCGRAALGKWVLSEITEADYNAWLLMQQRHYQRQQEQKMIEERAVSDTQPE